MSFLTAAQVSQLVHGFNRITDFKSITANRHLPKLHKSTDFQETLKKYSVPVRIKIGYFHGNLQNCIFHK